jgi:hypothetical protein
MSPRSRVLFVCPGAFPGQKKAAVGRSARRSIQTAALPIGPSLDLATPSLRDDVVSVPFHASFVPVYGIVVLASEIMRMADFKEALKKS